MENDDLPTLFEDSKELKSQKLTENLQIYENDIEKEIDFDESIEKPLFDEEKEKPKQLELLLKTWEKKN